MSVLGIATAALFVMVAAFQVAAAAGHRVGSHTWGGRFPAGLPPTMRVGSAISALVLPGAATVVLARSGATAWSVVPDSWLAGVTWGLAAFMALNTLGNFASQSRVERVLLGPVTAVLAVLCSVVAAGGTG